MKDDVKVSMVIIFIITILVLSIIPLTVQSVTFENQYGKLEVYPDVSRNIIRQKQYFNATSYLPSQDLDIAFRFNDSLSYGGVYYFNNGVYNKLNVEHIEYNDKHWYILKNIYFVKDEMKHGYWEYEPQNPINSSGKWDMFIKRSSDSLDFAIDNNLFVHLDPWWSSDWDFMKVGTINDACTDGNLFLNISYDSKMNDDFSDLRFLNDDNDTELYHWFETINVGNYVHVWVNISDSLLVNLYYNNSVAINSTYNNPYNTFLFFDDFNSINEWDNNADTHFEVGNGYLYLNSTSSYGYISYDLGSSLKTFMKYRGQVTNMVDNGINCICISQTVLSSFSFYPDNSYGADFYDYNPRILRSIIRDDVGTGYETKIDANDYLDLDTWYRPTTYYYDSQFIYDDNNNILDSTTSISGTFVNPRYITIYNRAYNGYDTFYDWLIVGRYCGTVMTVSWGGEIEQPSCECIVSNPNPVNNTVGVEWATLNLSVLVNSSLGCDIDYVNISLNNGSFLYYFNWSDGSYSNGTFYYNTTFNLSSATEYIWYVNSSCSGNLSYYNFNFTTFGVTLDDLYTLLIYINEKIIGVDDELNINIGLDGTLLTLVLFAVFFVVGYIINKRSGGILMIFSGFTLIAFEFLVSSVLNALLVIPLLSPIAILIIILGIRKWLYPVENEYTKAEGT